MDNISEFTKQMYAKLQQRTPSEKILMPPPFMRDLGMNFLAHEPGKSVKVSFPIKEAYNNPYGITFGGYFSIFFDAAFGPFSGLTAKAPTTSLDLNVTYLKPLSPSDKEVIVDVEVVSHSKTYMLLHGRAYKGDNILVATCTSRLLILDAKKMQAGKKEK